MYKGPLEGQLEAPGRGIVLMIAGSLLLTMNDAVVKWVSSEFFLGQILFSRGITALFIIALVLSWRKDFHLFRVKYRMLQVIRAALMIMGTVLFVSGLRLMPLAENITVAFVGPIFVTALAPLVLEEKVGWRRWIAVMVGFFGVLVMLRPGADGLNWAVVFPAGAALCGAFRDLLTRKISHLESSGTTLFYSTLGVTLVGAVTAPFAWQMPTLIDLGLLGVAGILLCGAHYLHIETFRYAEAALLIPFKYSSLLWAGVLGYLIWGDKPDMYAITGAALLILSGLYIVKREIG